MAGNIVVGVEFDKCGKEAFHTACRIAKKYDAQLRLVHVEQKPLIIAGGTMRQIEMLQHENEQRHEKEAFTLAEYEAAAVRMGLNVRGDLLPFNSTPGREIIKNCNDETLAIVVGRHGKGLFADILLGSVSAMVVRLSEVPVVVVPPEKLRNREKGKGLNKAISLD